jgi:hypothetical protein
MNSTAPRLVIPRERLPAEPHHRREVLGNYFGDLLPSVQESDQGWVVQLRWPDDEAFFVDPLITRQLDWWRAGARLVELRRELYWSEAGLLSLDDAWTLFGWSRWLKEKHSAINPPSEVVVVHIDDHRDMMCPRIAQSGQGWVDLLTGEGFSVFDPPSVRSAILSGAVGIGSFFAPLVHELPCVNVRHLSQSAGLAEDGREWHILKNTEQDTILRPGLSRPRIDTELAHPQGVRPTPDNRCGSYRFSRSHRYCFSDLPDCPVLLHIDMDYFNNRYDRDSDWCDRSNRHDPTQERVLGEIDSLFDALEQNDVLERIENVTVALSPGFFPAEYWPTSVERVEWHLRKLGVTLGRGCGEGVDRG